MFNDQVNEYVWSSVITFVAAFMASVSPFLVGLPMDKAAIFALAAVGLRAGVRAVMNLLTTKFQTVSSH